MLYSLYSNTTGTSNTANGSYSLEKNTTGTSNTANGYSALQANTIGSFNVGIGIGAGIRNISGDNNTFLGYSADVSSGNLSNATAIGYNAIATSSNSVVLGNSFITSIGGQVSWTAASDVRIKKNIINTQYGLATVMRLRPVEYLLKNNDLKQVGFIAQEVQKLVPEVITGKEGDLEKGEILGITYANLVPVLTKAIQEQQKQIEEQNKKIEYLIKLLETKK